MSKFTEALERMKAALSNPLSKIEGSFSMFNLRAVAKEFSVSYNQMQIINDNWSLDSATGAFLDAKAVDHGVDRHYARATWGEVTFTGSDGVVVPSDTVVAAPAYGVQFTTVGDVTLTGGTATAEVTCTTIGTAGNVPAGSITQIMTSIAGVSSVTNEKGFSGGVNREDDDTFRERIYEKVRDPATSGNKADYRNWAREIAGVGRVQVLSLWNGPGTVKVTFLDSNGDPASEDLVEEVQTHIDPEPQQEGNGRAPIGALVTVTTASTKTVDVSAKVSLGVAGDLEKVEEDFSAALDTYFREIGYDEKTKSVSAAKIGNILFDVPGIVDYDATSLRVNGGTAAVSIDEEEVLRAGTVTLTTGGGVA